MHTTNPQDIIPPNNLNLPITTKIQSDLENEMNIFHMLRKIDNDTVGPIPIIEIINESDRVVPFEPVKLILKNEGDEQDIQNEGWLGAQHIGKGKKKRAKSHLKTIKTEKGGDKI